MTDQRVIAWTLAYLWRTGGSVWSLRAPWAGDTSLVQPQRRARYINEPTALSVEEITRAQFRRDLEWRGLAEPKGRDRLRPDATIHLDPTGYGAMTDVHVELQSAAWSELDRKFAKYDRYLAGWCFSTSRYAESNRRPVVIFACAPGQLAPIMTKADELLRANVTLTGAAQDDRYCPARDHILFCHEAAIYRGDLSARRLGERPAESRQETGRRTWLCAPPRDKTETDSDTDSRLSESVRVGPLGELRGDMSSADAGRPRRAGGQG